ncbi:metallophosphoesterase [Ornithinibacillus sp. 179-J 7C1 HS]|uniref:metallophosphoesterase n=1 Tax=Ornithinibacillus sp. 179-J 7C1 HS TaxID=3142384 RepID=UPI0039A0059A
MPNKVKRKFYYLKRLVFVFGFLFILGSFVKAYFDTNVFKVNNVQFESLKLPSDFELRVLQISDVHNKVFGDNNEKLINMVEESNADFIVLTGDLIDRSTDSFRDVFLLVEEIKRVNQDVFFVTGNHEWENKRIEEFLVGLKERGITILSNENTQIRIDGTVINLVGIDNESTNHENMKLAFEKVDSDHYTILLSHSPGVVLKYDDIYADLILSGHTHGGQVRFPLIGAVIAPDQGFFPELDKGVFEFGEEQYLYIDSGLGTSIAPVRFLNQSQVSLIVINGVSKKIQS